MLFKPTSEDAFLALIDECFPESRPFVSLGRGDDAAVVRAEGDLCISTDLFWEDVHFRRRYFSPAELGYKALAVNLSDLAAMGAMPHCFTLALSVPGNLPARFWPEMFRGMAGLAREASIPLVGGDLIKADALGFCITVWGKAGVGGRFLRRGQAERGDALFLLGEIGLAAAGFRLLESIGSDIELTMLKRRYPCATAAHLKPRVYFSQGHGLAAIGGVHSLMDVSDGLANDLPRFLPPGAGAEVRLELEDLHPEIIDFCAQKGIDPIRTAFSGGEDYALLGSVAGQWTRHLKQAFPQSLIIGEVTDKPGIRLNGESMKVSGFDHFAT